MIKNFIKTTSIITIAIVILLIYPAMIQSDSSISSISIKNTKIEQVKRIALKLKNSINDENTAESNSITSAKVTNNTNTDNKNIANIKNIKSNDEDNKDEIINNPAKPEDQEEKNITVTGVVSSFDYSCQMPGTNYDIKTNSKIYYLKYKSAPYSELVNFVGKKVKVTGKVTNYNLEGRFSVIVVESIFTL